VGHEKYRSAAIGDSEALLPSADRFLTFHSQLYSEGTVEGLPSWVVFLIFLLAPNSASAEFGS
jgi:hypothetical protein